MSGENFAGLTQADEELIAKAKAARQNAYVPYSKFPVGAAVRARSGKVYAGTNIENSSYGLTICAERVAIFTAAAAGERELTAVAIVGPGAEPLPPCGACRQVMAEFGVARVIMASADGPAVVKSFAELLPLSFSAAALEN